MYDKNVLECIELFVIKVEIMILDFDSHSTQLATAQFMLIDGAKS